MVSADCLSNKTELGRNLTPVPIIESVRKVFNYEISLDPASDEIANQAIKAELYYDVEADGYSKDWTGRNVWLNPPGSTLTGGDYETRLKYLNKRKSNTYYKTVLPDNIKWITAVNWCRKLFHHWKRGDIDNAIYLVYRGGSIGSVGTEMIEAGVVCMTLSGATSSAVNNSGRISFDSVNEQDRDTKNSNTQSSMFILLPKCKQIVYDFHDEFKQYGTILDKFQG